MFALTSPYFWYTTRATGVVALVLFTIVVTMGTLVANRVGGTYVGRFEINELHRSLSIVAMLFLVIHILTTVLDSYVSTGIISAVAPFTSDYRRIPIAIGTIAFDLMLCVWVSSLLKVRIKNSSWRFIHWFSWLAFASAATHSFLTGSDFHKPWGLAVLGVCVVVVAIAGLWRFFGRPVRAAGRTALSPLARAPQAKTSNSRPMPQQKVVRRR
jgi:DMSO/TMAO reductase YedYZ heme-binding membrane subunit